MTTRAASFLIIFTCAIFTATGMYAQKIATLEVAMNQPANELAVPVQVNLDAITYLPDSVLTLVELRGKTRLPVACQIEHAGQRTLHWVAEPQAGAATKRIFELTKGKPTPLSNGVTVNADQGLLTVGTDSKKLLQYVHKTQYPPSGVDTSYKRSAFIHPLWSPHGQVLTRVNPPDHYHHVGLWNPWTKVFFEGDTVDFWNLADKKGTVRFANFTAMTSGAVFGEYAALHEHVVFKKSGNEKVALNEVQSVRVYQPRTSPDYYVADITIQMHCAGKSPVLLCEYRYGGLGWRATEQWTKDNSQVLTSEGKMRKEADGSTARWCMVQGTVDNENAGVVLMSFPTNYNHPEPLRVWPEDMYDRGDVFVNFSPTKNTEWRLTPGNTYQLKYRLLVFNGNFPKEKAESAWQQFAHPPRVNVVMNNASKK